jgi:kumamolisin
LQGNYINGDLGEGQMNDRADIDNKPSAKEQPSGLQSEATSALSSNIQIVGNRAELLDTRKSAPIGSRVGPSNPDEEISVTVMVKSKASDQEMNDTLQQIISGQRKPLSDAEFNSRFGVDASSLERVQKFAADNGLTVEKADANSGQVKLHGAVKDFGRAFGVQLEDYKEGTQVIRERSGNISVPRAVAGDIQGVFGLDNRQQAESHLRTAPSGPWGGGGYLPTEVADAYNFPRESMGAGQSVGIIELGGGLNSADNSQYYKDHSWKEPSLQIVGIDGAKNSPGQDADGEVALDCQVIGAVAPDANQQLIFAPNSDQGFLDAVTRATFPEAGEKQNTAISISWGECESAWSDQAIQNMDAAFKKAALKGISIFCASGDNGAKDNAKDGKYNADFPSSDPWVTGCGGTKLDRDGSEVVWNDGSSGFGGGATGGGISSKFGVPDFQKDTKLPANANPDGKPGRGDPDVSGNASTMTGYTIRVNGSEQSVGGTSAVSPLYAALTMRLNGALGHPVGYLNPFLYKNGSSEAFKDITDGNNHGYNAGPGWDACTGWGSINGQKLLDLLGAQGK